MFFLCENMKWAHLPEPGGIYNQHPDLVDGFEILFLERSKYQSEKEKEEERKNRQRNPNGASRSRR